MKNIIKGFIVRVISLSSVSAQINKGTDSLLFNDSHFHLTNHIQEGISPERFMEIMSDYLMRQGKR